MTVAKLKVLAPPPREACPEIVEALRTKLAEAERGELNAIAIVTEYAEGGTDSEVFMTPATSRMPILAQMDLARHNLITNEIEARKE